MAEKGKGGLLLALMGKPKGGPAPEAREEAAEGEDLGGEDVAAQEVLDAMKAGDVAALRDALKSFIRLCNYSEE